MAYLDTTKPERMAPPWPTKGPLITVKQIPGEKEGEYHRHVTVQIAGPIGPLSCYIELLSELFYARKGDVIEMALDTPGGMVFTAMLLVDAMDRCQGHVITDAVGMCASAGTILWYHGHERRIGKWGKFMFHGTSHGSQGNSDRIKEEATYMVEYMKQLLSEMVTAGILTDAEYKQITDNKEDCYITAEQMRMRIVGVVAATEGFHVYNEAGTEVVPCPEPEATPTEPATKEVPVKPNAEPVIPADSPQAPKPEPEKAADDQTKIGTTQDDETTKLDNGKEIKTIQNPSNESDDDDHEDDDDDDLDIPDEEEYYREEEEGCCDPNELEFECMPKK